MIATKVKLLSSDGQIFELDIETVKMSTYITKRLLRVRFEEVVMVPLPEPISGAILQKVIQWMEYHKNDPAPLKRKFRVPSLNVSDWDLQFLNVDFHTYFDVFRIAICLEIEALKDVAKKIAYKKIAESTREKVIDEIRLKSIGKNLAEVGEC